MNIEGCCIKVQGIEGRGINEVSMRCYIGLRMGCPGMFGIYQDKPKEGCLARLAKQAFSLSEKKNLFSEKFDAFFSFGGRGGRRKGVK